jgi:hypothetical protein
MGGHFLASYPAMGYRREAVAYFISRVIPTTSFAKISFRHHAFCIYNQMGIGVIPSLFYCCANKIFIILFIAQR